MIKTFCLTAECYSRYFRFVVEQNHHFLAAELVIDEWRKGECILCGKKSIVYDLYFINVFAFSAPVRLFEMQQDSVAADLLMPMPDKDIVVERDLAGCLIDHSSPRLAGKRVIHHSPSDVSA